MKRTLITISLIVIMLVAAAIPAMASEADAVDAALNKILAQFPGNAQAAKAVDEAKAWLAANGDDLEAGSGAKVAAQINAALATAGSAKTMNAMTADQQSKIIANAKAAAEAAGLTFAVSADGKTFTLKDGNTTVLTLSAANPVKQTGLDTTTIIVIAIGITVLFGGAMVAAIVTRKKGQPSAA